MNNVLTSSMYARRGRITAFSVVMLLLAVTNLYAATPSATDTVRRTIDEVLMVVIDSELDDDARKRAALDHISAAFDFHGMSQRVLATNWRAASATQRSRFVELFTHILANSYWRQIEAYRGQQIDIVGEAPKNQTATRVKTLIRASSHDIPMDYSLRLENDRWLAYDVVIEGVSLVSNYRSSYQQIARQDGIEGLLDQMARKLSEDKP